MDWLLGNERSSKPLGDAGGRLSDLRGDLHDAYCSINSLERRVLYKTYSTTVQRLGLHSQMQWNSGIMWTCMGACGVVWLVWQHAQKNVTVPGIPAEYQTFRARMRLRDWMMKNFTSKTDDVPSGRWWTTITSAFSHTQPWHLIANLITFKMFSQYLIYSGIPPLRYMSLILGSAVTGSLVGTFQQGRLEQGDHVRRLGLGLSGVCMGLGVAAAAVVPKAQVAIMGIVPLPLWAAVLGYVAFDSYMLDSPTSKIGHGAHIGGAAFGGVYFLLALRGKLPLAKWF
ncbi:hypothetical protein LTR99_005200 [Exophiala xenobiotica]|uniref:Peptidase S54 rhomboid domain-containing protein n=1 Tax=Vermiconidia calcicola TaxID=1690605 RepID=A0AAV9QA53_9PEZI|nr:hypothetical protein LTR99_005200 [Exophiala xenobiotica]KAK5436541.1 hypothetical protein LTR34_002172 [Exophiala xenobiotica]KAK5536043.1 hypothetical protein LTR25_005945 [Vermiconidia calcicola]KAK5541619.1 hypothetical protein LTR23_005708 [Chaetothyriales sp. CCFEE 6169]